MHHLLLVDDEADAREALAAYFPWHTVGFRVVGQAGNGQEALTLIHGGLQVDCVLADIRMPVMSGIELAEQLYKERREIQLIFLSSYREFEYAQQALQYRVKNYILKPAKYQMLMEVFGRLGEELKEQRRLLVPEPVEDIHADREKGILIRRVEDYIHQSYKEATLEEAARVVHLNPNYLSVLFKQKTGSSFTDYLIKTKMETAYRLLQTTEYKTYEISEMVGYSNAKNFTRTFKSFYGTTPSACRGGEGPR
ncbi:response regulator transcription factor [Paenibacillus daejeonensis]|uniref:response regulator transcription factor n=1 Tax=Paenibacillus daejeonensis TaxID=135193 RepID=UPI000360FA93|nr:response regulator [Paenibacillus daejeonensis]